MTNTYDSDSQSTPPPSNAFFSWLRGLGIVRGGDRWFAGVAGGIAAKAGIDPLIVRGVFVVLALLGGPGILLYLTGWLLLPDAAGKIHVEEILRGRAHAGIVTAAVILVTLVAIPAFVSIFTGGVAAPFAFAGWGAFGAFGAPAWLSATIAWLVWIAILVFGFIWVRRVLLNRGRAQNPTSDPGSGPAPHSGTSQGTTGVPTGAPSAAGAAGSAGAAGAAGAASAASAASFTAQFTAPHPTDPSGAPPSSAAAPASASASASDRGETFTPRGGSQTDDWSQKASEWSQRAGEKATQWSADVGKQADEWSARYAQHHDATKLGAGQTILTLALALLAGGLTALWTLNASPAELIQGTVPAALVAGIVAALVVLAISLIVAGVRGKNTGWVGFLSFCGVIALLITVVLPWGTRFQPFGTMEVTGGSVPGAVLLAGTSELDLRSLDANPAGNTDLVFWQIGGTTDLVLPEHAPAIVDLRVLAGQVNENGNDEQRSGGPLLARTIAVNLPEHGGTRAERSATRVTVYLGAGVVDVSSRSSERTSTTDGLQLSNRDSEQNSAEISRVEDELRTLDWKLEEPGLSPQETTQLERERDALNEELHELEDAR
ncbi:phage shock protein C (PspC) family protein [Leucobacter luti]|uniref:PspC domain-containing protein n=1 Tax=Leucobacter luti TaxID=340320 RepID=UPI00104BBB81|nr:PspC domain-containing protein [Leucobacter luti]MCW2288839.1 phage shock protein PspC (stress-responsive transcriptional regulator) [Leucobacter luti]TCK45010.1 phage shock protein C (PspC) family protein [Leucobacter luti]